MDRIARLKSILPLVEDIRKIVEPPGSKYFEHLDLGRGAGGMPVLDAIRETVKNLLAKELVNRELGNA